MESVGRLGRTVHLEVLGKQGLEYATTRKELMGKQMEHFFFCKSGINGAFIVYKHHYMSMVNLVSNLKRNVDYRSIKYYTHQHVILCSPLLFLICLPLLLHSVGYP